MGDQGVTIGLREIYDKVQEVALGVQRLNDRITVLEVSRWNINCGCYRGTLLFCEEMRWNNVSNQ
jgi:hypothetical protein